MKSKPSSRTIQKRLSVSGRGQKEQTVPYSSYSAVLRAYFQERTELEQAKALILVLEAQLSKRKGKGKGK